MDRLMRLYKDNGLLQWGIPSPWLNSVAACELLGQQLLNKTLWGQVCKAQGKTAEHMMDIVKIALHPPAEGQEMSVQQLDALARVRKAIEVLRHQQVDQLRLLGIDADDNGDKWHSEEEGEGEGE